LANGTDRDIEFVLVTGAGASRAFGVNGMMLPLMADWSSALVKKLRTGGFGYVEATGLSEECTPQEFEAQLGLFLRQVVAFQQIERLVGVSRNFPLGEPQQSLLRAEGVLEAWHSGMVFQLSQVVKLIHESLYDLFAEPAVDIDAAAVAYGELLGTLGIGPSTSWVYATTNYDTIGEIVIARLGGFPDWGEPPQLGNYAERRLHVDDLIEGIPRYVPVLHIHGRVGWYRRTDPSGTTTVYSTPAMQYQEGFGVPIVMLPDPDKEYDTDSLIDSIWAQFNNALRRARRVLVLGHSLNDTAVVQALRENVETPSDLAVTVLADERDPNEPSKAAAAELERLRRELPGAAMIPMRFGDGGSGEGRLAMWLGNR
jgi:hypothetical protein